MMNIDLDDFVIDRIYKNFNDDLNTFLKFVDDYKLDDLIYSTVFLKKLIDYKYDTIFNYVLDTYFEKEYYLKYNIFDQVELLYSNNLTSIPNKLEYFKNSKNLIISETFQDLIDYCKTKNSDKCTDIVLNNSLCDFKNIPMTNITIDNYYFYKTILLNSNVDFNIKQDIIKINLSNPFIYKFLNLNYDFNNLINISENITYITTIILSSTKKTENKYNIVYNIMSISKCLYELNKKYKNKFNFLNISIATDNIGAFFYYYEINSDKFITELNQNLLKISQHKSTNIFEYLVDHKDFYYDSETFDIILKKQLNPDIIHTIITKNNVIPDSPKLKILISNLLTPKKFKDYLYIFNYRTVDCINYISLIKNIFSLDNKNAILTSIFSNPGFVNNTVMQSTLLPMFINHNNRISTISIYTKVHHFNIDESTINTLFKSIQNGSYQEIVNILYILSDSIENDKVQWNENMCNDILNLKYTKKEYLIIILYAILNNSNSFIYTNENINKLYEIYNYLVKNVKEENLSMPDKFNYSEFLMLLKNKIRTNKINNLL
jgi:hypothetical protein